MIDDLKSAALSDFSKIPAEHDLYAKAQGRISYLKTGLAQSIRGRQMVVAVSFLLLVLLFLTVQYGIPAISRSVQAYKTRVKIQQQKEKERIETQRKEAEKRKADEAARVEAQRQAKIAQAKAEKEKEKQKALAIKEAERKRIAEEGQRIKEGFAQAQRQLAQERLKREGEVIQAVKRKDIEFLRLNSSKVDLKKLTDSDGCGLLHIAAKSDKSIDVLGYLLDEGLDIDAKNVKYGGWTPLHYATHYNEDGGNIRFLIERGANIGIKDLYGLTPIMLVEGNDSMSKIKRRVISETRPKLEPGGTSKTPVKTYRTLP